MANIKSSKKDIITSKKRRNYNVSRKSMLRTLIKKVHLAILKNEKIISKDLFSKLQVLLDRFSRKGLIHKNKASRYKSKLCLKINKLS